MRALRWKPVLAARTRSSAMVSSPLPGVRMARLKTLKAACRPFTFFACVPVTVACAGRNKELALRDAGNEQINLADVVLGN